MERLNDVVNRTINKEPLKESSIEFCANQGREVAEVSPNLSLSPMINPVGTGVAATAASGTAAAVVFPPKPWKSQAEIVRHAVRGGARSLLTMYLMRGGVTVIIKLLPLLKGKIKLLQALEPMWRMETLRFAAVFGGFNFIWRLVNNLLIFHRKQNDRWNGFISGSIAALAILFETKENRIGMAQQFFVRGMQATYNALHARNYVSLTHGDSLLFMFSCASIMYGYTMAPDTIPREYYGWIVKTGRIPHKIIDFNRKHVRALESGNVVPDLSAMESLITKFGGTRDVVEKMRNDIGGRLGSEIPMPIVPCTVIHPHEMSCITQNVTLALKVFRDIFPVNCSLNIVPLIVFRGQAFVKSPISSLFRALKAAARSSTFLSFYVTIFGVLTCLIRNIIDRQLTSPTGPSKFLPTRDIKGLYYIFGLIAASSVFVESKSRRPELALYVLPKGLQSLFLVFEKRGAVFKVPGFDIMLSMGAMGSLMAFYQTEPQVISSLLYKFMSKVLGKY